VSNTLYTQAYLTIMLIGSKSVSNGYEHVYTGIAIVSGILFGCKVLYNFFGAKLIG